MESTKCIITGHVNCDNECPGRLRDKRRQERERRGEAPLRQPRTREERRKGYEVEAEMDKILDQVKLNPHFSLESSNSDVRYDKSSRAYKEHIQGQREMELAKENKKLANRVKGFFKKKPDDELEF